MATQGADEGSRKRADGKDPAPRESPSKTTRKTGSSKAKDSRDHDEDGGPVEQERTELSASQAAGLAMRQVMELAGRDPESVTSLERTERGWRVGVEVVETRRIPDSADILAVYEAELDQAGELLSYRRSQRYPRGHSQE